MARAGTRLRESRAQRKRGSSFGTRLFNVLYLFFSGLGSIFVFLIVLFMFEDWVLLTLGVLVVLGILWTSKHAIPKFWSQAALLLNMGVVREGERLIYNGIPWRVKALNFYTILENPKLEGGTLRLPVKDLFDLRSREYGAEEPWFPTDKGDWVLIGDDIFGIQEPFPGPPPVKDILHLGGEEVSTHSRRVREHSHFEKNGGDVECPKQFAHLLVIRQGATGIQRLVE